MENAPYELWERILQFALDVPYVFDTTVTTDPSSYMAQLHNTLEDETTAYQESERTRKHIGMVCKSWRNWALQQPANRYITLSSNTEVGSSAVIRGANRIDLQDLNMIRGKRSLAYFHGMAEFDSDGDLYPNQLRRLQLRYPSFGQHIVHRTFFPGNIFTPKMYTKLEYLNITLPEAGPKIPWGVSTFFHPISLGCPQLKSLVVENVRYIGADQPVNFPQLIFLCLKPVMFDDDSLWLPPPGLEDSINSWKTPNLRHFIFSSSRLQHSDFLPNLRLLFLRWNVALLTPSNWPPPPEHPLETIGHSVREDTIAPVVQALRKPLEEWGMGKVTTLCVTLAKASGNTKEFRDLCERRGVKLLESYRE